MRHASTSPASLGMAKPCAWVSLAASLTLLMLIPWLGSRAAAGFLGIWAVFAVFNARSSLTAVLSGPAIWAIPAMAVLSTAWSVEPAATLRFALQLVVTFGCAVIAARHLAPRHFVSATLCALTIVLGLSLLFGRYTTEWLTGAQVFIGVFATKNAVAGAVAALMLAACAVLLDRHQAMPMRVLGAGSLLLAGPILLMTKSATSVVTSVFAVGFLLGWYAFMRLTKGERALVGCAVLAVALPLVLAVLGVVQQGVRRFVEDVLGRDVTLTGRTLLWEKASELIAERPWLGYGFQTFWQHGNLEAEGIWRMFRITARSGFNFHNLYVEIAVGLGLVGAALLVVVLAYTLVRALLWSLADRSVPAAFFCAFMAFALIRSLVEVEIFGQFWAMSVIYCAAMRYALDHRVLAVWPQPATRPDHAGGALAMRHARYLRGSAG